MENIHGIRRTVRRFPETTAIRTGAGNEYTFAELDARSNALATALDARIGQARSAGLLLNGAPAVTLMVAAQKRGIANAQLSFRGAPAELAHMVETAGAEALVFDDANAEAALAVIDRTDVETAIHVGEATLDAPVTVESYESVIEDASTEYTVDLEGNGSAESAILFTSGTTSKPKAVLQDQKRAWLASSQAVMEMSLEPADRYLTITPWYHDVTTVTSILPSLQVGATMLVHAAFDPVATLEAIESHGITVTLAVPTQLRAIVDAAIEGDYDVSSLRIVRTGGAVVTPDLIERTREHLITGIHNTYGLTEGFANLTHAYPEEQIENPGTMGQLSFVWEDIRVVEAVEPDETPDPNAEVDRGEVGEMIALGPGTDGYLDRPEAEEALFVDGWLRTGDVVRVDEVGGLHYVDRNDNMIVSGGENVYPQEVEQALLDYDGVDDVAVMGVPDEHWGERVIAVVVGSAGADELDEFCLEHDALADYKRPRRYVFADDALPRSDTGTLLREEIRAGYVDTG